MEMEEENLEAVQEVADNNNGTRVIPVTNSNGRYSYEKLGVVTLTVDESMNSDEDGDDVKCLKSDENMMNSNSLDVEYDRMLKKRELNTMASDFMLGMSEKLELKFFDMILLFGLSVNSRNEEVKVSFDDWEFPATNDSNPIKKSFRPWTVMVTTVKGGTSLGAFITFQFLSDIPLSYAKATSGVVYRTLSRVISESAGLSQLEVLDMNLAKNSNCVIALIGSGVLTMVQKGDEIYLLMGDLRSMERWGSALQESAEGMSPILKSADCVDYMFTGIQEYMFQKHAIESVGVEYQNLCFHSCGFYVAKECQQKLNEETGVECARREWLLKLKAIHNAVRNIVVKARVIVASSFKGDGFLGSKKKRNLTERKSNNCSTSEDGGIFRTLEKGKETKPMEETWSSIVVISLGTLFKILQNEYIMALGLQAAANHIMGRKKWKSRKVGEKLLLQNPIQAATTACFYS